MHSSRISYSITVFISAFLLFLIEPIAAKQILPALGGSSAVWMTCLVFFQLMLLLGYLYAHALTTYIPAKRQPVVHIVLLAAAIARSLFQLGSHPNLTNASEHPVRAIFLVLTGSIGLPFLLLASTSPLLQVWLARRENTSVKFRLFAMSNAGSFLALILYPTLVEPHLTLNLQRIGWSIAFVLTAILCALISRQGNTQHPAEIAPVEEAPPSTTRQKLLWFLLPLAAAMQLSAVTGHLTQNIAAIPLLWILPLAAYLLTFILAFDAPRLYRRFLIVRLLIVMLAALGYMLTKTDMSIPITISILFFLVEAFIACWFLHAETYNLRPRRTSEATLFYLLIASGGVVGSFFIGIASPLIFDANYDIAISFFLTAVAALLVTWTDGWAQRLLWTTGTVLLFAVMLMMHTAFEHDSIIEVRNFYGSLRVRETHTPPIAFTVRTFLNGTIQHGTQWFGEDFRKNPTTYYADNSGIGLTLNRCCTGRAKKVGVIGLGAGTLAAYGQPPQNGVQDNITFYEINSAVEPIAKNVFTYIRDSQAKINIIEGDARISLTNQPPQNYDVIAVDAFSGDAIPLHLITREAMALYKHHLAPGGVVAFHVSNQYLSLAPEVALLAQSANMQARVIHSPPDEDRGAFSSTWVLVTSNEAFLAQPEISFQSHKIPTIPNLRLWTDDYSSLLPILHWHLT
ncbi:fused MFS/spermidine synthase [Acidicapsa ligni]|uniref:fused MFS/spermidine synthase n=1 Tax=Acidicapsa ligni TaxID=542300 RepID=UPI0021E01B2E|nr:fused MFS/spermidine synthase [Acidicapsa ligni]